MLVAKISPAASFVSQSNPFSQPETTTVEHMAVVMNNYVVGGGIRSNFQVIFGFYTPEFNENSPSFTTVTHTSVDFTSEELSNWGTDDSFILNAVANKLGTSVVEVIEKEHILGII
jgi:hypothetical protein